jgi:hypothetical protein
LRAERKARNLPSRLQRAWVEETPSAVMGSESPPVLGTIQMRVSFLSILSVALSTE